MAETLAELRALSDEELEARHDAHAKRAETSINYYMWLTVVATIAAIAGVVTRPSQSCGALAQSR